MNEDVPTEESFKPQYLYIEKIPSRIRPKDKDEIAPEEEQDRGVLVIEIL